MIKKIILIYLLFFTFQLYAQPKVIHTFVALCDNVNQGIVPVKPILGNGEDPRNNLYWGALYGVKTYFKRSKEWKLLKTIKNISDTVLERCIFKHIKSGTILIADAYKGKEIKQCTIDFLNSAAGHNYNSVMINDSPVKKIPGYSSADLLAYIGHDGLMEFSIPYPVGKDNKKRPVIILACISEKYFKEAIKKAHAKPLLWTTGLMAPEAYTLEAAVNSWLNNGSDTELHLKAAKAYHKYQNCGLKAAKRLLGMGY